MQSFLSSLFGAASAHKREIEIMYFGRPSELLMMTSERVVIPEDSITLEQVLNNLRNRGTRWADELDEEHVICTLNGKAAVLSETVTAGDEMCIFSRRSLFE